MEKQYLPIESNPEVIAKYVNALGGPKNIHFIDVVGIDKSSLDSITGKVIALLLLFPIDEASEKLAEEQTKKIEAEGQNLPKQLWFIKQTVRNACGTIAILHSIANGNHKANYEKGGFFDKFFEKVKDMNPDERAKILEENEEIEKAHASAGFEGQSKIPNPNEDVNTHFITFVEVDNHLYELDGRKKFPIDHGNTLPNNLLYDAAKVIEDKFMKINPNELRFNLIAITTNN